MLYTSYYGYAHNFPQNAFRVSISIRTPFQVADVEIPKLAPDEKMVWDYKNGRILQVEYTKRYTQQLDTLLAKGTLKNIFDHMLELAKHKPVIFLCYEKPKEFCHRHILAEYVKEKLNIDIKEFKKGDE